MSMLYKNDWDTAKERLRAWWAHEYFGRCALSVTAPKDDMPASQPEPRAASIDDFWYGLDYISRRMEYTLSRKFFGGEAEPVWNGGYAGHTAIPAYLGCPVALDWGTAWWTPTLTAPEIDLEAIRFDATHPSFLFAMDLLRRGAKEAKGRSLVSLGAFGGSGDSLAGLRGTEQLLIDCIEQPEAIKAAEERLMDIWITVFEHCYEITNAVNEGSTYWMNLWSPGRTYAVHNDFSYNISPAMFRELFLPAIKRQTEFLDHSIYHVDGVNAFVHVDALLELPRLQAFQIYPGEGKPSPLHFMDLLKKIQAAGRNLHLSLAPGEVKAALSELSARGLYISTKCATESDARQLLKDAERWSVDR